MARNGIEPLTCQLYYRALLTAHTIELSRLTGISRLAINYSCYAMHYAVFKVPIVLPPIYTLLYYFGCVLKQKSD